MNASVIEATAESETSRASAPGCRFCGQALRTTFVDLGMSPLCQTHIEPHQLNHMEPFFPLHAWVCERCFLVQLEEYVAPANIFSEYAYFSSYADSWVEHARKYSLQMRERFGIGRDSLVMEIASNDGYLLQHFVAASVPVLGIEPAANVAKVAQDKGIRTEVCFHGRTSADKIVAKYGQADLLLGNNVLAHVPDLNDFVAGMKRLLKPSGVITMEFPHLQRLMEQNQFDTIYHEHFSYFSFFTVEQVFAAHGLTLFDVDELSTHGGSIRIYARHAGDHSKTVSERAQQLRARELALGFDRLRTYQNFAEQVKSTKRKILSLLIDLKNRGKSIVGYGAPGKGNTLLNYCGIRTDLLSYTVDRNPYKQGKYTPGTHIPILTPDRIRDTRPDYVFILPWNLKDEICAQMNFVREWGGQFIVPIPEPQIL
ncbi:MAG TPA: class I SAM-dependent methyltransferase [Steroidobacteraceae bacterium]|nr:class I SAM-dependent methyltransferase [Steroidobacteraceae bacterium]